MTAKIFSVYDVKAQHFQNPFTDSSVASALRGFSIAVSEPKSVLNMFPDDFALFELGEFDKNSGAIKTHASPVNLGSGRSVLQNAPQTDSARTLSSVDA